MERLRARLSLGANSLRASQEVPPPWPAGWGLRQREGTVPRAGMGWGGDAGVQGGLLPSLGQMVAVLHCGWFPGVQIVPGGI